MKSGGEWGRVIAEQRARESVQGESEQALWDVRDSNC